MPPLPISLLRWARALLLPGHPRRSDRRVIVPDAPLPVALAPQYGGTAPDVPALPPLVDLGLGPRAHLCSLNPVDKNLHVIAKFKAGDRVVGNSGGPYPPQSI